MNTQQIKDLEQAFIAADEAGNEEDARFFAQELAKLQNIPVEAQPSMLDKAANLFTGNDRMTQDMRDLPEIGNADELNSLSWPAFKTSLGLLTTSDEEKQMSLIKAQYPDAEFRNDAKGNVVVSLPSGEYALNKPGVSAQDIGKLGFDMAAFTPAAKLGSVAKTSLGFAGTEAGMQTATNMLGGGDIEGKDIAVSGLIGGLGKTLENTVSAGARAWNGTPNKEFVQLVDDANKHNIPLMTTDIAPPQTWVGKWSQSMGEKVPLVGTGENRAIQLDARKNAIGALAKTFGDEPNYKTIADSIANKHRTIKDYAGGRLSSITEQMGERPVFIDDTAEAALKARESLNRPGTLIDKKANKQLDDLMGVLAEPQTVATLRENRTRFKDLIDSVDTAGRSQMPSFAKRELEGVRAGISKDIEQAIGDDLGQGALSKYLEANAIYADQANKMTKSRLKGVLDKADYSPENVANLIFSKKPTEIKQAYQAMDNVGRTEARKAIVNKLLDASQGADGISPEKFLSALERNKDSVSTFFRGENKAEIEGLKRVLEATKQASRAGVKTPTGEQLLPIGAILTGEVLTGSGLGTATAIGSAGIVAKAYESKAVRNLMAKLANTPKNSTDYDIVLRYTIQAITNVANSVIEVEDKAAIGVLAQ